MDYAEPAAPDVVCDRIAEYLRSQANHLDAKARELQAQATVLNNAAAQVEREARSYRQWQPKEAADA